MENIYITGLGILSCLGIGVEIFWNGLTNLDEYNLENFKLALDIPQTINSSATRRMDRFSKMALVASKMAVEGSSFVKDEYDPYRIGSVFSTCYGPLSSNLAFGNKLVSDGVDMVSPTVFASTVYNACVGHVCINLKIKGVSTMLMGSNSLGYSYNLLQTGKADAILCGGIDEHCQELDDCFNSIQYITKDTKYLCRPLDKHRSGTKNTEGSAILMLETERIRSCKPDNALCKIIGYANSFSSGDPGRTLQPMDNEAFVIAMKTALKNSNIAPEQINGIFMAANGVKYSDSAEAQAIHSVFEENIINFQVTAIKGAVGEAMGASFSLNVAAAALSLYKGEIPPTLGYEETDAEIGLNVVRKTSSKGKYKYFLVNGYDFSGSVYSMILGSI